jgi:hypothetical protein
MIVNNWQEESDSETEMRWEQENQEKNNELSFFDSVNREKRMQNKKFQDPNRWILTDDLQNKLLEQYFLDFFQDGSLDIDDIEWKIQVEEYQANFHDDKYGRKLGTLQTYDLFWYTCNLNYNYATLKQMCRLELISREYAQLKHKRIIQEQTEIALRK